MNTQDRVNEKIAKVALKNQEVNLGLAQDLLQEYKRAVDTFTDAQSTMDRALEMLKSAKKIYEDIEQKSKQLGVDVDSQIKKLGTNLDSFIKSASKR
tara:strand:+ start:441 stop:731 length:291 start_codon:yes stop_codon:yes gene_type:complete